MSARRTRIAAIYAALGLCNYLALWAQNEPLKNEPFFDTVNVSVVNIEVVVTSKEGTPVTGLTRDDFEVYEDGRLVELSNFFAVENREAVVMGIGAEGAADDDWIPTPETKRLNLVVFVDNLNILPESRNKILMSLRKYLGTELDPRDQVMLVTMAGRVEVVQGFTSDREKLLAAVNKLEKHVGLHAHYQAEHRRLIRAMQIARLSPRPPGEPPPPDLHYDSATLDAERAAFDVRQLAERKVQKVNATCKALTGFVDTLAGMRGRKAVLYVSDGLNVRPADSLAQAWLNKFERWVIDQRVDGARDDLQDMTLLMGSQRYDVSDRIEEMVKHASASGVAFYPIAQASGLLRGGGGSAEFGGSRSVTGHGPNSQDVAILEQFSLESSLLNMAEGTGGIAFTRTANLGGLLRQVVSDFENFYSLGYNRAVSDETTHKIEVWLKDPDLKVRYLQSFREKDPISRLQDLTLLASHYGLEENVLNIRLDSGEQVKTGKNSYHVPITIKIPFQNLLLLPQEESHAGKLTIVIVARDEWGGMSRFQDIDVPFWIPNDQLSQALAGAAAYLMELEMNRGKMTLSVGVRDQFSHIDSTRNLNLTVGEARPSPAGRSAKRRRG